jgi:hypothetical protein
MVNTPIFDKGHLVKVLFPLSLSLFHLYSFLNNCEMVNYVDFCGTERILYGPVRAFILINLSKANALLSSVYLSTMAAEFSLSTCFPDYSTNLFAGTC